MLQGIGGIRIPTGTARIQIPLTALNQIAHVDFQILKGNVETFLSMREIVVNEVKISIQRRHTRFGGLTQKLSMENYFIIHRWRKHDLPHALYSEAKLRTIHRTFGHPSVRATEGHQKRVSGGALPQDVRDTIENISHECDACSTHTAAPRSFNLTVGTDGPCFNHSMQVGTIFLRRKLVIHIVDMTTHFCAASFLRSQSAKALSTAIQTM